MVKQGSQRHLKSWATEFIQHLLGLTHKQWLYQNARTHIRLLEGKSELEHDNIMDQVGRLLFTCYCLNIDTYWNWTSKNWELAQLRTGNTGLPI